MFILVVTVTVRGPLTKYIYLHLPNLPTLAYMYYIQNHPNVGEYTDTLSVWGSCLFVFVWGGKRYIKTEPYFKGP